MTKTFNITNIASVDIQEPSVENATIPLDVETLSSILQTAIDEGLEDVIHESLDACGLIHTLSDSDAADEDYKQKHLIYSLKDVFDILNSLNQDLFSSVESKAEILRAFSKKYNWLTSDIKHDAETGNIKPFCMSV